MRGYRHRRARFAHRGYPLNGMIWMIGLGVLFYTGHWWPGILILIGVSTLLSAVMGEDKPPEAPEGPEPFGRAERRSAPYAPPPLITDLPPASPAPAPAASPARVVTLPSNCPRCGAPVRTNEVKWTGSQSAACGYCGSNLQATRTKPI